MFQTHCLLAFGLRCYLPDSLSQLWGTCQYTQILGLWGQCWGPCPHSSCCAGVKVPGLVDCFGLGVRVLVAGWEQSHPVPFFLWYPPGLGVCETCSGYWWLAQ